MKRKSLLVQLALLLGFVSNTGLHAQPNVNGKYIGQKRIYYGAAYYPEVWPEAQVAEDIKKMKALNMNVMRIAEFSWSSLEPKEGQYNLGWLERVVDQLGASGIDVMLGTPTATPPVWMLVKHPDMLQTNADGGRKAIGQRRDCSYSSQTYRQKSVEIVREMAKRLGSKKNVIAWQTDNEFSLSPDYSQETRLRWQAWLQKRYGSIEKLNKAWHLETWSMAFPDFSAVPMPKTDEWLHPSLRFNWLRFTNEMATEYQQLQVDEIRKHSKAPVTHDGMPGQAIDYDPLFKNLDFWAVNNYHSFEAYDLIWSNYDRMRGAGKGMHWLTETAPSYSGGGNNGSAWFLHMPDSSMRAAMWMNHALGAQGTMFWLWQQHPGGQEMTHGSIYHSWGAPAANIKEIQGLGDELAKHSNWLMNHPVAPAQVAILWSHEAKNGLDIEKYANDLSYYKDWTYRFFLPITTKFIHRDVIYPSADVNKYKVIFAPLMPYVPAELKAKLKTWVNAGGTLVMGPMTGYRNEDWCGFPNQGMGDLEDWIGTQMGSRIVIGANPRAAEPAQMLNFEGGMALAPQRAGLIADGLKTKGKVLARYANGMLNGEPAITEATVGKGKVVVLGTDPGQTAVAELIATYAKEQGIMPVAVTGSKNVIVAPRLGTDGKLSRILINLNNADAEVDLGSASKDLLTGRSLPNKLKLRPYNVVVAQP